MKLQALAVLASLFSAPLLAQGLPDEINHQPYLETLRKIELQIRNQESQIESINQDIAEARRFIQESRDFILATQNEISQNQSQIEENRRVIPALQSQISQARNRITQLERDRQGLNSQLGQLRSQEQQLISQLRPLEDSINRRLDLIRRMESELGQFQREEQTATQRVQTVHERIRQVELDINQERASQAEMRRDLSQIDNRIQQLQLNLANQERQLGQLQSNLRSEESNSNSHAANLRQAQSELESLRRAGPTPAQLQAAEAKVRAEMENRSRAQQGVSSAQAEINRTQSEIAQLKSQQDNLRRDLATVDQRISQVESSISSTQAKISQQQGTLSLEEGKLNGLNQRVNEYQSELSNLRAQNAPADQIQAAERKLRAATSKRDETITTISSLKGEISGLNSQIGQLRNQIETIRREAPQLEGRISQLQSNISRLESTLSSLQSNLRNSQEQLNRAESSLAQAQSALEAIRRQGPSPEQLQQAENKVRAAQSAYDSSMRTIQQIKQEISSTQNQQTQLRSQIDNERRAQSTLPNRIAQSENRERDLQSRRGALSQELASANGDLNTAQRRIEARVNQINQARNELRNEEVSASRISQQLEIVSEGIRSNRAQDANLTSELNQTAQTRDELVEEERLRTQDIPKLEAAIRNARTEISQSESEIKTAQAEEAKLLQALSQTQTRLAQSRNEASSADGQYQTRLNLYRRYLEESKQLGVSQTGNAESLGLGAGSKLAKSKAVNLGKPTGEDLGKAEGHYWSLVRAEIQGYPAGYEKGRQSQSDIQRAQVEASGKATKAARDYAEVNLKPVFFNDQYLQALKAPVLKERKESIFEEGIHHKSLFSMQSFAAIEPISKEERELSQNILTSLDQSIDQGEKVVEQLIQKRDSLRNPDVAFELPLPVPFGAPKCTQVYKAVKVFQDACLASYKNSFQELYESGSFESFAKEYPELFAKEVSKNQLGAQPVAFEAHFKKAYSVAEAEGIIKGKKDIFDETYEATYQDVYARELPKATELAEETAAIELESWIKDHAAVTIQSNKLSRKALRGGDEVSLLVDLKNISNVDAKSVVLLKVSKPSNAIFERPEVTQEKVKASSITTNKDLVFKIPAEAKSGQRVSFQVEAFLPGHKYQQQRIETFKVETVLAANPKLESNAKFDANPNIRIIRFKTHTLSYSLKPVVEDVQDGYEVELQITEGKDLINLAPSTLASGPVKLNETKTFDWTYTFDKNAKGKKVQLKVIVRYLGETIKETLVDMVPR